MNRIIDGLWIGDIQDARRTPLGEHGIDRVITVCQDSVADNVACAYEHYALADSADHNPSTFEAAAAAVRAALADDETVLVHCHVGRSRAPSVSAAALAADRDLTVMEAYEVIREVRMIHPNPALQDAAREYVAAEG